ncbi:murein biosynthesis integral membrane protein MurJ [Schaalia sp. lx-260]|uniref:murein biosynthesis integral membrane protein MurJ n=1 Tax=Schaalia sp. lx-260 TaxID=2899082 RepID=UPI001E29E287|nr:murein biosynthesis integral membrane protein MurJ [Schaalia sp. lx-260]MCD4550085.1 murein biosynthesis integral membrane protein MurJ [Schaalia sp. lx-260]
MTDTSSDKDTPRVKNSLLRDSAVMASGTFISRILGFIRNALLLIVIGSAAGGVNAAFQTANTLPNTIYNILASGVFDAILVPHIVSALKKRSGDVYVNRLLTLAGTVLFGLSVVALLIAPLLVIITAAGYDTEIRSLAIAFSLLCLPQIFFYGVYNLLGELLNARGVFGPYMWSPVVNNLVAIAGLLAFLGLWGSSPERFNVADFSSAQFWLLGGSATLGVILQALLLLWPMKKAGIHFRPDFHFRGTSFGKASFVAKWTFATLAVSHIGILSSNNLAALADTWGHTHAIPIVGVSAAATAFMVFMLPHSLITVSLTTAVFTRIATAASEKNNASVARHYDSGVRTTIVLMMLCTAIGIVAAVPLMQSVMLTHTNTEIVRSYAWVLIAFMPGLTSLGITMLSQRVFFAYEDARPVFFMGIIPTLLQVIVGWSLYALTGAQWWVICAAFAESCCRVTQGFIAMSWVKKRNPHVRLRELHRLFFVSALCALACIVVGFALIFLMGIDTVVSSSILRLLISLVKILVIALCLTVLYVVLLRFALPHEYARLIGPFLKHLPVPAVIASFLGAPATAGNKTSDNSKMLPAPSVLRILPSFVASFALWKTRADKEAAPSDPLQFHEKESSDPDHEAHDFSTSTTFRSHFLRKIHISEDADSVDTVRITPTQADTHPVLVEKPGHASARTLSSSSAHIFSNFDRIVAPKKESATDSLSSSSPHTAHPSKETAHPSYFNPTKPTLIIVIVTLLVSMLWAVMTAFAPVKSVDGDDFLSPRAAFPTPTETPSSDEASESAQSSGSATPTPVIDSATVFSWNGSGDFEEDAHLLIDGDSQTRWHSRYYELNNFPENDTVTLLFTLKEPTSLSEVTMSMDPSTTGGEVILRAVTPTSPREGTLLASSSMGPTTVLTAESPVETQAFSLSFRKMPTSVDGLPWAWVGEVTVK